MSEDINPALLTIPEGAPPNRKNPSKQTIVRLHPNDHTVLKVMLKKDKMSMQRFIGYCVRGYMDADPLILKMIKTYRELDTVPRDIQDKHVLSNRERQNILDEIEKGEHNE